MDTDAWFVEVKESGDYEVIFFDAVRAQDGTTAAAVVVAAALEADVIVIEQATPRGARVGLDIKSTTVFFRAFF
jgi:hypothetical protein